jgi:hypothetical protein
LWRIPSEPLFMFLTPRRESTVMNFSGMTLCLTKISNLT